MAQTLQIGRIEGGVGIEGAQQLHFARKIVRRALPHQDGCVFGQAIGEVEIHARQRFFDLAGRHIFQAALKNIVEVQSEGRIRCFG